MDDFQRERERERTTNLPRGALRELERALNEHWSFDLLLELHWLTHNKSTISWITQGRYHKSLIEWESHLRAESEDSSVSGSLPIGRSHPLRRATLMRNEKRDSIRADCFAR